MNLWLEAFVLGIIQGLTEYLPISSTGHIRIAAVFMGIPDPGAAFSAVTQLGTAFAVGLYFRRDLKSLVSSVIKRNDDQSAKLFRYMVIATIPIVIVGFFFADFFETTARDLRLIAAMLIVFGVLLYVVDKLGPQLKGVENLSTSNSIWIGLSQVLALVPGVSRSGVTMTMGRLLGFDRVAAARISFLLSLPAIFLSAIYQLQYVGVASNFDWIHTAFAALVSFITGYLTIEFILRWLTRHTFTIFAIYRVMLGLVLIAGLIWFDLVPVG